MLARLADETQRGVVFISGPDREDSAPYSRLLADARRMLGRLRGRGIAPGEELVLQTSHNRALLTIFWACVLGGIIPVPLARARQPDNRRKLWGVWPRLARPWLAVDGEHWEHLRQHDAQETAAIGDRVIPVEDLWSGLEQAPPAEELGAIKPQNPALVQFSSGSTGQPKGVCLSHANLLSNLGGMATAAAMTTADSFIGWMPLTHDMGLIAFHLLPAFLGVDQFILDTAVFIRRPGLWLNAASRHRVSVLGSPTFGLQLLLASLRSGPDPAWDLSRVRILFNSAEPISPKTCDRFLDALAPCGLPREAMYTAYGLAEGSVGAAFPAPGRPFARVHLDRGALGPGQRARELPAEHPDAATFVVEGRALPGTEIAIHDEHGRPLPQGVLGRIVIRGRSVTAGYYRDPAATAAVMGPDGWLDTGDLGLFYRGELVVTGRAKDVIFARGQNYYSHDLERVAEALPGVGAGKSLAVGLTNPAREAEEVIVFLRHRSRELSGFAALAQRVRETIARDLGLAVDHVLPVDEIPKTTSGKLRRYLLRQRYLAGGFAEAAAELAALGLAVSPQPGAGGDPIPPRLAALWAAVLDIPDPPAQTNFFALGGDSLRVLRLVALVQDELGLPVQAADLFDHPSLAAFAVRLAELAGLPGAPAPTPAPPREHYPATPNQVRLHALQAGDPDGAAYNLAVALRLRGGLDPAALERALQGLVAAHEPLRTGLEISDGSVVQRVHPSLGLSLAQATWPASADPADPAQLGQVLRPLIRPFDLARPPLMRATLLRRGPDDHFLLLDLHHAIADGGSLPRLLADLGRLYAGGDAARDPYQFKDHAAQAGQPKGDQVGDLAFWLEHLADAPPRLDLPLDFPRPPWPSRAGNSLFADLDPAQGADLRGLAGALGVSPHQLLLAAFAILLARHADQEDFVLATVAQGRHHPGCRDLVGMFVNTLPLRLRPAGGKTLAEFLAEVRNALAGALRHQDQPLEELPARLGLARQPGRDPLFDAMFAPEDFDAFDLGWPGLQTELLDFDPGTAKFDLTLFARPRGSGYRIWLEYATDLFAQKTAAAMLRRYQTLLARMVQAGADARLRDFDLLDTAERRRLLVDFNATGRDLPRQSTLDRLISAQARTHPEAVSLAEADGGRTSLTYDQLERAGNRAAWRLMEQGLGPGGVAAMLATRSCDLVAGVLAVLKSGAAFLPLEPDLPPERLAWLAADSGARALLLGRGQIAPPGLPPGL
ncbi:MAG: condensation domain-containing protein, partial [Pseudomonadota bacterium]